jgi:hypothetical protein
MTIIDDLRRQIKESEEKIKEIQADCSHPLSARLTLNSGATGNYDDPEGTYWTEHHCTLCDKKWHTDQSWRQLGDGKGMPKSS